MLAPVPTLRKIAERCLRLPPPLCQPQIFASLRTCLSDRFKVAVRPKAALDTLEKQTVNNVGQGRSEALSPSVFCTAVLDFIG